MSSLRAIDEVECTIVTARMTSTRSRQKEWGVTFRGLTLESKVFALTAMRNQSCGTIRSMHGGTPCGYQEDHMGKIHNPRSVSLCSVCVCACIVCLL